MLKTIIIGSVLVAAVLAIHIEDLNRVEYGPSVHNGISLPYPYQDDRDKHVVEPYYYEPVVIPAPVVPTAVGVPKLGLIATVESYAVSVIKSVILFVLANGLAVLIGVAATLGLCNLTPICSKLSSVKSLLDAQREFRSLATSEQIAGATEFVKKAIRKFRSIQE